MNKLHDNIGIIKNAKYMNDNMYGVMAVKSAKSVYVSFLWGIDQYFANKLIESEKNKKPNTLFIIGKISP